VADATLGAVVLRTSLDASGLKAGLNQARGETDQAVSAISKQIQGIGRAFTTAGNEVKAGLRPLSEYRDSLRQQDTELRQLIGTLDRASTEYGEAAAQLALVRTELDRVNAEMREAPAPTRRFSGDVQALAAGLAAAGGALYAARGLISGARTYAGEAERAANATLIFSKQVARSGVDIGAAEQMVDRLAERFGVLPQTVQEAVTLLLRAGGTLEDAERLLTAAGASAAAVGFDIGTAFDNAATAVATGRSELLETSGIVANLGPVTQAYAKSIGKTVEELTEEEVVRARVNAIYQESKAEIEDVDQLLSGLVGTEARVRTEAAELRQEFGQRFLPIVKAVGDGIAGALGWFNDLPQPIKTAATGLAAFGASGATLITTAAGLKVALTALGPAFAGVRAAMLPFLGPVGILAGAVAGYIALNEAMNAGRAERAQASADFRDLVSTMGAYRDQLVITSEEERWQLIASLERRREALTRILQMQQAMIRGMEAEVIAFANMPWYKQLFNFGSVNVTLDALEQAERDLQAISRELDEIDTQLGQARVMEITPNVTPPPPVAVDVAVNLTGTGADALSDPAAAAKRWVERLEAELRFGLKGPSEVIDLLSPRVEELREEAANALAEFGIDSQQYQDTVAKLDVVEGALDRIAGKSTVRLSLEPTAQVAEARPLGITPTAQVDTTGLRSVADIERDLAEARARVRAAGTAEARAEAQALVLMYEEELKRVTTGISLAIEPVARVLGEARQLTIEPTVGLPGARPLGITPIATVGDFTTIELLENQLAEARRAVRTAASDEARHEAQLVVMKLEQELERLKRQVTPRELGIEPRVQLARPLGIEPTAQVAPARSVVPEVTVQIDGMDPAEWVQAQEDAAAAQRQAGFDFAQAVIGAGQGFVSAIEAFQAGNVGGGIAGLGGAVGGLFSGLGQLGGAFAGLGPWGAIISAGAGLLGGLVNLFGGGRGREADRAAAEARRVGNVPAINLTFTVNQTNTYHGAPSQPEIEQAFRRQANTLWEELYRRNLGPRLDRIEQRLGIAGAGA